MLWLAARVSVKARQRYRNLRYAYTNVAVTVAEMSYFGMIANPHDAHEGYARSPRVVEALMAGSGPTVTALKHPLPVQTVP